MKTISFGHGTFRAEICLDELPNTSVRKVRKLLELMFQEPDRNNQAIATVSVWLSSAVPDAKAVWALANQNFSAGWRKVKNKRSRLPEVVKQLQINDQLTEAVKSAKAKYDRLVKLQSVYREFTN